MTPVQLKFDLLVARHWAKCWGYKSELDSAPALENLGVERGHQQERNTFSGKGAGSS